MFFAAKLSGNYLNNDNISKINIFSVFRGNLFRFYRI